MPYSDDEGKEWIAERVARLAPASVLDIGPGAATYAKLLRPLLSDAVFTAVEIYEPYRAMFDLDSHYDQVFIGDARYSPLPPADVVILGDVVEHMDYEDGCALVERARHVAMQAVFVSLPIIEYPQGSWGGNEHEAHLHTWSHEDVLALPGVIDSQPGKVVGCYQLEPK